MIKKVSTVLTVVISAALILILGALHVILPDTEISESERRHLASFPEVSADSIFSGVFMENIEKYLPDQFPFRETFRTIKANFEKLTGRLDTSDIYSVDGYLTSLEYELNINSVKKAGNKLEKVLGILDTSGKAYISVIPSKAYYMNDGVHPVLDFELMRDTLYASLPSFSPIDITGTLELESYYKTDSHWRQEKLFPTVSALISGMGIDVNPSAEENYTPNKLENFYGVYAGQSALGIDSETIVYLTSDVLDSAEVTYVAVDKSGVYDQDAINGETVDMYDVFLGGAVPIIELKNTMAETDRELILIRDSFGSSITPLLLEYYSRITVVDLRYISSTFLPNFVDSENADVLALLSPGIIGQSEMMKVE